MMFDIAISAIAVSSALFLLFRWGRWRLAAIKSGRELRTNFYAIAHEISERDDTPPEIIFMFHRLISVMHSRSILWRLTWHGILGRWIKTNEKSPLLKSLGTMSQEQQLRVLEACGLFAVAITCNNLVLGGIWRRVILLFSRRMRAGDGAATNTRHPIYIANDVTFGMGRHATI